MARVPSFCNFVHVGYFASLSPEEERLALYFITKSGVHLHLSLCQIDPVHLKTLQESKNREVVEALPTMLRPPKASVF